MEHNVGGASERQLPPLRAKADAQITTLFIEPSTSIDGNPQRSLAADARLTDGTNVTILVTRNMRERWMLLDQCRDRLHLAGIAGVVAAFLMS